MRIFKDFRRCPELSNEAVQTQTTCAPFRHGQNLGLRGPLARAYGACASCTFELFPARSKPHVTLYTALSSRAPRQRAPYRSRKGGRNKLNLSRYDHLPWTSRHVQWVIGALADEVFGSVCQSPSVNTSSDPTHWLVSHIPRRLRDAVCHCGSRGRRTRGQA